MEIINNCDELLAHLCAEYGELTYCCGGHLEFQGDVCEVWGYMPDWRGTFMPSPKFHKTVFSIQDGSDNNHFILCVFKGDAFILDQTLGVELPNYVKDELVATIQGYN